MSTRRDFVKTTAAAGAGLAIAPQLSWNTTTSDQEKLNLALIGVGLRGTNHLNNALQRDDVNITAICDIDDSRIAIALKMIEEAGQPKPEVYNK